MNSNQLIDRFQKARSDKNLVIIEGVQALKHAARFGAELKEVITCDINLLTSLLDELAPDVKDAILTVVEEVSEQTFAKLSPQPPRTKVIALALKKEYVLEDIEKNRPIVALEDPRDLENIGAVIRVAAAANAAAVCITGPANIWHPAVLRGGAGLHFAVPVFQVTTTEITKLGRPLISLDPTGEEISSSDIPSNAVLIFGTERHGISQSLLNTSNQVVRLPMKQGVSSLNLATSVAATLYRLG